MLQQKPKEGFTGLRTMYNKTNRGISHFTENTITTIKEHVSRFTRKTGIANLISQKNNVLENLENLEK